jgi:hypothetical protein
MDDVRKKITRSLSKVLPATAGAHAGVEPGKVTPGSWGERGRNNGF